MVRLRCKCGKVWNETKAQQEAKSVFCPKCGDLHHIHSEPINPPKVIKGGTRETTPYIPSKPMKPLIRKKVEIRDLNGKFVRYEWVYVTK